MSIVVQMCCQLVNVGSRLGTYYLPITNFLLSCELEKQMNEVKSLGSGKSQCILYM